MEQPGHCLNCGALLHGPYCHACGQPVKGMVRHLRSVLADVLDIVFEYDSRIWRSLVPLYFRPGRITLEFLAGKRARFVLPFRLFFLLTVGAFLVLQLVMDPVRIDTPSVAGALEQADSIAEVEAMRKQALAELDQDRADRVIGPPGALDAVQDAINRAADQRLEWLRSAEAARLEGRVPPPPPALSGIVLGGMRWDADTNPVRIDWLPDAVNAHVNDWIGRAQTNLQHASDDPKRLLDAFLGMLPAALFVLMPIFALLLKIFYLGRHWLYTAHLVVALHSHSFLALAMMIGVLLDTLADALEGVAWLAVPIRLLAGLAALWIPVCLLLMQRRVYAQGWITTVLKFVVIGVIYTVLLIITGLTVAAISLVVA